MSTRQLIDLRSDTVTKPTEEMRRAMYEAEVGDDTYDGDPTVIRLQELAAEKTGKEAALYVASGTMGNLIGVLANTRPGQEVILGDQSHQFLWEVGGIARVAGCVTHTVPFHRGWLDPIEVEVAIRPMAREAAASGLICVEDTSNTGGGAVIPPTYLAKISEVAKQHDLPIHMDGARLFNAAVASGCPASDFVQYVDTVSFCLTKGLSAPFGAMLCGSQELIERAISFRQVLGGGMLKLAMGLAEQFPDSCSPDIVETNLFHVKVSAFGISGQELANYLAKEGILVFPGEPYMRLATHRMITSADIDSVLKAFDRMRAEQ
jgi:threonine aldolase